MRLAETVCGWHNPPGVRKCEEIPYALIRLMTSHYQWNINAQTKHAPPRLGAPVFASRFARLLRRGWPLRYGPRHYIPPLRGSHLFLCPFPGVWGFESSLSTPSQAAPCGAPVFASRFTRLLRRGRPPPGYFIAPLRGSNLGSRLRCCAATPWQALTLAKLPHHPPPSNSDLSGNLWGNIARKFKTHPLPVDRAC